MTATNLTTTYVNIDVADSISNTTDITSIGGGPGAGTDGNVYIQGDLSISRRINNQTRGFYMDSIGDTSRDLTNQHVKVWVGSLTWPDVTQVDVIIDDGTNRDQHTIPSDLYPPASGLGFIPVWLDPARTPETNGNADITAVGGQGTGIGIEATVGSLSSNADNMLVDSINYGPAGYAITAGGVGTESNIGEVDTAESVITTGYRGVLSNINGIYFCYARLVIGSSSYPTLTPVATTYLEEDQTVVFPDQTLCASDWNGITIDLGNASTSVTFDTTTLQSSNVVTATNRPDFIVDGTTGSCTITNSNLLGMRTITLTSACSVQNSVLDALDITQGGSEIENSTINTRSASGVAVINDATFGTTTGLNNVEFVQAGTGHAIEITSPGTYTFTNLTFTGYLGTTGSNLTPSSGDNAAAILNSSGGLVTINVSGGNVMSVRNTASSTTQVNKKFNLKMTRLHAGTELRIFTQSGLVEQGGGVENVETAGSYGTDFTQVAGENPDANGLYSVNYEYNYSVDTDVYVVAHNVDYIYRRIDTTLIEADATLQIDQSPDRQYI